MFRGSILASSAVLGLAELYCPGQNDYSIGGCTWNGAGWTCVGEGGVHGKQTFNLLGGYIEFDIDTSGAHTGVNNNLYLVSPKPSYFSAGNDCDIQGVGKPACMEMDIIENNGNCVAQTTWHTWPNHNGGCDQRGCGGKMSRSGTSHVKAEFAADGYMTVYIGGNKVEVNDPAPSSQAVNYVKEIMSSDGAQIQSSQWAGWVPDGNCGGGGGVGGSTFSIKNVKVSGSVVQGPEPSKCAGPTPTPAPTPAPVPTPTPAPSGKGSCHWGGCSGGDGGGGYCSTSKEACASCFGGTTWCPEATEV